MVERVESVMPRLMTHCGEALKEEMNEGGEERRVGIGGKTFDTTSCPVVW